MIKLFFLNESVDIIPYSEFVKGMLEIAKIIDIKNANDDFLKHETIYNYENYISLCSDFSYDNEKILNFLEQLTPSILYLFPISLFNENYKETKNGYLGVDSNKFDVGDSPWVTDISTYNSFRSSILLNSSFREFWRLKDHIFKNIILCGQVEEQISKIGNSSYFRQIFEKLLLFDAALMDWEKGDFSYRYFNEYHALRISPESDSTLAKYENERKFSLPNGGTKVFDLHIKTGDLRFHFYPDNTSRMVYVGYIGPHLRTVSN